MNKLLQTYCSMSATLSQRSFPTGSVASVASTLLSLMKIVNAIVCLFQENRFWLLFFNQKRKLNAKFHRIRRVKLKIIRIPDAKYNHSIYEWTTSWSHGNKLQRKIFVGWFRENLLRMKIQLAVFMILHSIRKFQQGLLSTWSSKDMRV